MKLPATLLAAILLALIALAHVLRLVLHIPIQIDGWAIPAWWSAPAILVPGALAFALWRERRR